jgi:hypothetical protein
MTQLKAAQDRKNELANEYEKLKAQLEALQKQLDEANRLLANDSERTYLLRAREAAWNAFLDRDPRLRARWEIFLETPLADLTSDTGDWMLSSPRAASIFGASTQPSPAATTSTAALPAQPTTQATTAPATDPASTATAPATRQP